MAGSTAGPQHTQQGQIGSPHPPSLWPPADGSTSPKSLLTRHALKPSQPLPASLPSLWPPALVGGGGVPSEEELGLRTVAPEPHPRTVTGVPCAAQFCPPSPGPHTGVSCLQVWPAAAPLALAHSEVLRGSSAGECERLSPPLAPSPTPRQRLPQPLSPSRSYCRND